MTENQLSFSIVVSTDGRLPYLRKFLRSMSFLRYRDFEVVIVVGPSDDGARAAFKAYPDIKLLACPVRNLSVSRNIGLAAAAGDIVAFIDDDAVPEAEWLDDLAQAYSDPEVGAAGGFVYDNTGVGFQARYVTTDRLGYPNNGWAGPATHLNFPLSMHTPHLLGTNCSFRRAILLDIGGFDEEFEYFLDETDVSCRINDAGYKIAQLPAAFVHHKFAASVSRDVRRVVSHWYPLLKNRVYFGIRNGRGHNTLRDIMAAGLDDARSWEDSIRKAIPTGVYTEADLDRFLEQADAAIIDGCQRGAEPARKLLTYATRARYEATFQPFAVRLPVADRRVAVLVTQDYPPGQNGGIARNMSQLARSLAAAGHHVHVLTRSRGDSAVDFEDGVWVHRLAIRRFHAPDCSPIAPLRVPQHIWDYSCTMLAEAKAIDRRRHVDVVYCPIWDCEPIAFVEDGVFPIVCALQTTMKFWLDSQPGRAADVEWMNAYGIPIIEMEQLIIRKSTVLHANSRAIVNDIERKYDLRIERGRVFLLPHGMEDWSGDHPGPASTKPEDGETRVLFVGRLESRKGIDVLLSVAQRIARDIPNVVFDIVGDDTIPRSDGTTYKSEFLKQNLPDEIRRRIVFHGRVEEDALRRFYAACAFFVAPSRYESFGLVFLEAMMFGKAVIGCDAGGGPEVVTDGVTGLLVAPGDAEALEAAILRLLREPALCGKMGRAGRVDYQKRFSDIIMRDSFLALVAGLNSPPRAIEDANTASKPRTM